jgi:hypothetical protein
MKGKVHLFRGEYSQAADEFRQVMNSGEYRLVDNYFDNFKEETEHNVESIFEIQFNSAFGGGGAWSPDGNGAAEVTFRGQEYGFSAWRNVIPSQELVNEFEAGDPRFDDTFYVPGDTYGANNEFVLEAFSTTPDDLPNWKKYQRYYKQQREDTNSGVNFRYMRYADVLLMMAECQNELGNQQEAISLMNQVRARPSVNMPPYPTAQYPCGNQQQVLDAIMHERAVELAGEQIRFEDLKRWGVASQMIPTFQSRNNFLPIPASEIDANEAITNADQNPGY